VYAPITPRRKLIISWWVFALRNLGSLLSISTLVLNDVLVLIALFLLGLCSDSFFSSLLALLFGSCTVLIEDAFDLELDTS
jgi:hypothetical protein